MTAGFHILRTKQLVAEIPELAEKKLLYYPAYGPNTSPDNWFDNSAGRQIVFDELEKNYKSGVIFFSKPYLLVPLDSVGALETFMMNSLSEQNEEKSNVILQAKEFVKNFSSQVYLRERREKVKAELGVSLSVFSPDKVFTTMKELIDSAHWETFATANTQFERLKEL